MAEKKIGWFSPSRKRQYGSVVWSKPDGTHVEITHTVSSELPNLHADAEDRGEVVDWVSGTTRSQESSSTRGYDFHLPEPIRLSTLHTSV